MTDVQDLQGHWRRVWIKAPGFEDHSTHVHWMQNGTTYVDLRVPADLPDLSGVVSLSELPPEALLVLMDCEGFAGTIDVADSVCTWDRAINWHGTPKAVDAGRMWFESPNHLIEDGVHAEYRELWMREGDDPHSHYVFEMNGQTGFLVLCDTRFALGCGDPTRGPSDPLRAALASGRKPDALAEHFASHYAYGRWDGTQGVAEFCTNPLMCGQTMLQQDGDALHLHVVDFEGITHRHALPIMLRV